MNWVRNRECQGEERTDRIERIDMIEKIERIDMIEKIERMEKIDRIQVIEVLEEIEKIEGDENKLISRMKRCSHQQSEISNSILESSQSEQTIFSHSFRHSFIYPFVHLYIRSLNLMTFNLRADR
jgi:hypothetical protein